MWLDYLLYILLGIIFILVFLRSLIWMSAVEKNYKGIMDAEEARRISDKQSKRG